MFDGLDALDDAGLLATMAESVRTERAAVARRMVSLGLLTQRRLVDADPDSEFQCIDDWEALAAEVGAELGITRGRASGEMSHGETLVTRLPALAQRFLAGEVDVRVITTIDFRTALVQDPELLARLDAMLADQAPGWNKLSKKKLVGVIDWLVTDLDPEAQRITADRRADRCVEISPDPHQPGMAQLWGRLPAADGATLDERLDAVAATVCGEDPRTKAQRRADALIAVSEGATTLACGCGNESCAAGGAASQSSQIVVHVLAEQSTVTGASATPGYVPGYGPIPAESVREVAKKAKLRPLIVPTDVAPEPHYRPSAALAEFVRNRDLTCRWEGCDVLAEHCDLDHTIPYPHGPTHPSNVKCYCRVHHLVKTFLSGLGGWSERQHPDGTMTFRSPSGRIYTTKPGGALFFPQLATPTGALIIPEQPPPTNAHRALKMPRRTRTRAAARAARIESERALRRADTEANPPPF